MNAAIKTGSKQKKMIELNILLLKKETQRLS